MFAERPLSVPFLPHRTEPPALWQLSWGFGSVREEGQATCLASPREHSAVAGGVGSSGLRCHSSSPAGSPPLSSPQLQCPQRSQPGTTRPEGAGLPWGTSCQGEGWLGSPALPAMARSGWFPPQPPGAGGALPGLWLDKGYSLQELKISLLKKKRRVVEGDTWAQADSSHGQFSRAVCAGKVDRGRSPWPPHR